MSKVAIVTDTSGVTLETGKRMGIYVVPMPFEIDGEHYREGEDIDVVEFYEKMLSGASISTSQPTPGDIMDVWDKALSENDELVYIPLSSGLSGTYDTSMTLAKDYEGKVFVVNAGRVSVTMHAAVEDAYNLAKMGWSAKQIQERLEQERDNCDIYIMIDDLQYLKRGGRVTPAAAALGSLLKIKPILEIRGGKLDAFAKVRSMSKVKRTIYKAIEDEMARLNINGPDEVRIMAACSYKCDMMDEWVEDLRDHFKGYKITFADLPLNITCHTGPNCLAVAMSKRLPELDEAFKNKQKARKKAIAEKRMKLRMLHEREAIDKEHELAQEKLHAKVEKMEEKLRVKNEKAVEKLNAKYEKEQEKIK